MSEKPLESPDYKSRPFDSPKESEEGALGSLPILDSKGTISAHVLEDQKKTKAVDIPMKYRWTAFAFILVYSTGAAFAEATLGPLKSTLLKELKINSESELYS